MAFHLIFYVLFFSFMHKTLSCQRVWISKELFLKYFDRSAVCFKMNYYFMLCYFPGAV